MYHKPFQFYISLFYELVSVILMTEFCIGKSSTHVIKSKHFYEYMMNFMSLQVSFDAL